MNQFHDTDRFLMILHGCRTIELTKGYLSLVDEADYEWLDQKQWRAWTQKRAGRLAVYARGNLSKFGKRIGVAMHRYIMMAPEHLDVDHKNGDGIDNRRSNLRLATRLQNTRSRMPRPGQFKGIKLDRRDPRVVRWTAAIVIGGKKKFLGSFQSAEEAAQAYDVAAVKHFGEFAWTNFKGTKALGDRLESGHPSGLGNGGNR
jgi:hypothetical protein